MTDPQLPEESVDGNYFLCTLGQAAAFNAQKPHSFKTVNEFIDHQARKHPTRPALAFPIPPNDKGTNREWNYVIHSK